jgi:alpha-glucosidase
MNLYLLQLKKKFAALDRVFTFIILFTGILPAQEVTRIASPNGNIIFSFRLSNKMPVYNISLKGKKIIDDSALGLSFEDCDFKNNLKLNRPIFKDTVEDYVLVVGKTKKVHAAYRQLTLPLEKIETPLIKINIVVRVFDDGVALHYEIPLQKNTTRFILLDETTDFNIVGNPMVHTLQLPNYTSSHEGLYTHQTFDDLKSDTLMDMPTLFELPNKIYLAITEAALIDYAGAYLMKHNNTLTTKLSPLPHQMRIKVKAALPHNTPWRVAMISDRIGDLLETNILTTLAPPCKIENTAWIKPGKTTFPWWNGNVFPDTINAPGNNFVSNQYYIDFCARNGIEYHSVVEYGLHQWYMDDGISFQPGPHADVTTPVPGLNMKEICDYAKTKNVDIRVWVHFYALYPKLDSAFAIFEKWGLKGMMVDFMDRDDQEMVNMQNEILEKAAAHHLHIQFHGAYKPTGLNRTYPNEFTREGTLNYEADKWNPNGISPDHDIIMPFTRGLAGSTDFHLGGFRAVPKNKFRAQYTRPLMLGTRCHMLAMYVVLENYLQMVCDYPEAYEGQDGFQFIKDIPTNFDEIKVLDATVNETVTVARRNNSDWYIGTINNHTARDLRIALNFLEDGKYTAQIYKDAENTDENPNRIIMQTQTLTKNDFINVHIASGGGLAVRLVKLR